MRCPGPVPVYDKILKTKLQYTFSGTVCNVFKGAAHHGGAQIKLSIDHAGHVLELH